MWSSICDFVFYNKNSTRLENIGKRVKINLLFHLQDISQWDIP